MSTQVPPSSPRIVRVEPLRPRGLKVRLHLDDGEPLEVTLEALEVQRLGVGDTLTAPARHHLLSADQDVRVREAALNLLSYRARTRAELRRRLRQKGFEGARIEPCLDRLELRGLLDDDAVAAAFVRDRLRHRPRGKARLVSELKTKGLDTDTAQAAIERVFEDEGETDARLALESAEGWLSRQGPLLAEALGSGEATPERDKARRRLHGYLSRRGFRGDALSAAMDHAERLALGES